MVELARELSIDNAQDVSIIAPFYFNDYLHDLDGIVNVLGRYVDAPLLFRSLIRKINPFIANYKLGRINADIIHETYYFNSRNSVSNAKVVITVHDMVHEKFPQYFAANNSTTRLKVEAVKRADHVICVSENTRKDLLELVDIDPNKTSVVHHGFSLRRSVSDWQAELPSIQAPYLLYVGSREGYKNFFDLIRAYASSPGLSDEFKLICFGGGSFTSAEKAHMASFGLSDSEVQQLSGDDQTLSVYYKNATALIYPSKYEGFGIPPLEAMSFDCPVVCSDISSIPEVVGDAGEYFCPNDLDSMRDAIQRVVQSATRRQELIVRGRNRLNYFSWSKCAKETLAVYNKTYKK